MIRIVLLLLASIAILRAQAAPPPAVAAPVEEVLQIPEPGRFKELFRPFRTDNAALSPDGKYLAYSVRDGEKLSVVVIEIDNPGTIKAQVQVIDDESATPMLSMTQTENTPARINWLGWTSPTRVVVETNGVVSRASVSGDKWASWRGAVLGFDADGGNAKILLNPKDLDEFDGEYEAGQPSRAMQVANTGRPADRPTGRTANASNPAAENSPLGESSEGFDRPVPVLPQPDERLVPPVLNGTPQLRTVHVLDFDHTRPGSVLLVVTGDQKNNGTVTLALYSLDGKTGKLKAVSDEPVARNQDTLLDRQGRIRLGIANSMRASFPHVYEYLGAKGTDRPKPLDTVTGLAGFSASPENYFGERAIPLGFDYDPEVLYYAANTGRDTYGVYSVNLKTKQRGHLAMENPLYDLITAPEAGFPGRGALVFDRFKHQLAGVRYEGALGTTAWTRADLQQMQAGFEQAFPGLSVKITDWDEAGRRFIVTTEGPSDPGAILIYDAEKKKLLEFVRRAPWIDAARVNLTRPFSYTTKDGARLSGLITAPRQPRLKPIPMVVLCPDLPWQRVRSEFQAEVQALADMGFVVVQLNGRGAWGLGLKQRQSLTAGYDQVQVADVVAAVTHLQTIFQVNARRVALLGRGHGGFIALRTLQDHPDMFRCAVALDAPVNLTDWLSGQRWGGHEAQPQLTRVSFGDAARLAAEPLVSKPESITKPVLMLNYPGPRVGERRSAYSAALQFSKKVQAQGTKLEFGDLKTDYMNGLPVGRAAVFDRIEEFLNLHIYDFSVKVHETKVIK
jgi:dipeptidyl aminopeptidase/acylaminoacyl peptidase